MKIDGEKGEGPELMKKFSVAGYPTVIFLDVEGNEIDRIVGFGGDKNEYVQQVKDYLEGKGTLAALTSEFENGKTAELAQKIAQKYAMRKDDENAGMYYQAVMQLDPQNETGFADEARYRLAGYAAAGGDMSKLNEMIASLADDSPWLPRAYSAMAGYSRRNGDLKGAVTAYEAAIKRMPEDANMMNSYAWFVFKSEMKDQYARAIEVAQKAVELEPKADAIWDTLGQLHFANGNAEAAIEAMTKAAELNPEEKSYKDNLVTYRKPKA